MGGKRGYQERRYERYGVVRGGTRGYQEKRYEKYGVVRETWGGTRGYLKDWTNHDDS